MGASIYLGKVLSAGTNGCNIIVPTTPAIDPDAQAFLTAAGITDATISSAINTLVVDLKGYSLRTKMKRIYPMGGGTADKHKYDLVTRTSGTFYGGWTHLSTGSLPNGTTGCFDTGFNPSSGGLTAADQHISYYSRTNTAAGVKQEAGVVDISNSYLTPSSSNRHRVCANRLTLSI